MLTFVRGRVRACVEGADDDNGRRWKSSECPQYQQRFTIEFANKFPVRRWDLQILFHFYSL